MKIAVISDLHIGRSKETHQLGHTDDDFLLFLDKLEKKYEKIILLGDIYETDMDLEKNKEFVLQKCKDNHNNISNRFNTNKYIYIFGNHDLVAQNHGIIERLEIIKNDKKYLFIHGHQFDELYKLRHLNFLGWLILKLNLKKLYKWISEKARFGSFSLELENKKFESRALNYAKDNGFDFIITGHTHHPRIIKEDNITFLNSGTCSFGRFCYLHMDLKKEKFYIKNFTL